VVEREVLADGTVRLKTATCSFHFRRLKPGALLVTVVGDDKGELGMAPLDEMSAEITRFSSLELLVDARSTTGVDTAVADHWTAWFKANRTKLKSVNILTTSKFMTLVMSIAKHLSRTGDMIAIHSKPEAFEAIVRRSQGS
jgi:hypothetical protein